MMKFTHIIKTAISKQFLLYDVSLKSALVRGLQDHKTEAILK